MFRLFLVSRYRDLHLFNFAELQFPVVWDSSIAISYAHYISWRCHNSATWYCHVTTRWQWPCVAVLLHRNHIAMLSENKIAIMMKELQWCCTAIMKSLSFEMTLFAIAFGVLWFSVTVGGGCQRRVRAHNWIRWARRPSCAMALSHECYVQAVRSVFNCMQSEVPTQLLCTWWEHWNCRHPQQHHC